MRGLCLCFSFIPGVGLRFNVKGCLGCPVCHRNFVIYLVSQAVRRRSEAVAAFFEVEVTVAGLGLLICCRLRLSVRSASFCKAVVIPGII